MRKLFYPFALFALLCCIIALCACAGNADTLAACPNEDEHLFTATLAACPDPESEGEMIYSCVHCGATYAEALPRAAAGELDLTIDPTGMTRAYNAARTMWPTCHTLVNGNAVDVPVEFAWYKLTGGEYQPIADRPMDAGSYRLEGKVYYESGALADTETVDFTIMPADFPFIEADVFIYTGASYFETMPVKACGEDMIGYTVYFKTGNAGAEIMTIELSGTNAHNYAIHEDYTATILPKSVDISGLSAQVASKVYDATGLVKLSLTHADLDGIFAADGSVGVTVNAVQTDVCEGYTTTFTAQKSDCGNYVFTGSAALTLTITPATFTPPVSFVYNGQSVMTDTVATGLGQDKLTYSVAFSSKNVGATVLESGVGLQGEKAANYVLATSYAPVILPKEIDLSSLEGLRVTKRFDGSDLLRLTLTQQNCALIPAGESVTLQGNVGQILPCRGVSVTFTSHADDGAGNYAFEGSFGISLTVERAQLLLDGVCELAYTGDTVMPLPYDSAYASGLVEGYPAWTRVHFASKNAGATAVEITVIGEYADCYELVWQDFDCRIVPKRIKLTSSVIQYPHNGEDERVEENGSSFRMLNFHSSDDVCAVLRFVSADVGASLLGAELTGADARNYVLDISGLTATIVKRPGERIQMENLDALSGATFHPDRVIDPVYTPARATLTYYRLGGESAEPLEAKPNVPGTYRAVILCAGAENQADTTLTYDFSIVAHEHRVDEENSTPAICETAGETVYRCDCGDVYSVPVEAPGHDHQLITTERTSCSAPGIAHYQCACGDEYTEEVPAGHSNNEYGRCTVCGNYAGTTWNGSALNTGIEAGQSLYRQTEELAAGTYTVSATSGTLLVYLFDGTNYTKVDATFTANSTVICYVAVHNTGDTPIDCTISLQR